jgi:hypothetical protein
MGLAAAATVLLPGVLSERIWRIASADGAPLVPDTLRGLVAFIVPDPDKYSVHQGITTTEPGGIYAIIVPTLISTLDQVAPGARQFLGGTTQQYFANSPRAMPGAFSGYQEKDGGAYDFTHLFPFSYDELRLYYEWVETTLPVQTSAMGTKELTFYRGAERIGLPVQTTKEITRDAFRPQENAILQPRGQAGRTDDPAKLVFPISRGCTLCGHCMQGCYMPRLAPANVKAMRSTQNSCMPMALTADLWTSKQALGKAATLFDDAFVVNIGTEIVDEWQTARR